MPLQLGMPFASAMLFSSAMPSSALGKQLAFSRAALQAWLWAPPSLQETLSWLAMPVLRVSLVMRLAVEMRLVVEKPA
jgi:hypothetical protein